MTLQSLTGVLLSMIRSALRSGVTRICENEPWRAEESWLPFMKLSNAERAFIDIGKLHSYCLSSQHPRGRNKARVFASLLGLTASDAEVLRDAILKAVLTEEAETGEQDDFGQRYIVDFQMSGPTRSVTVRSAWIVRTGEDFPGLTRCYIL
jgi:hypothetical protein